MIPISASFARNVVPTETLSNTASTATPASSFCSSSGIPSFSKVARTSGSTSSRLLSVGLLLGRRVVDDVLVVDRRVAHVLPRRLGHREPGAVRLQAPLEQPRGLALLLGDQPDDVLAEALRHGLGFDVGDEAVLVFPVGEFLDRAGRCGH